MLKAIFLIFLLLLTVEGRQLWLLKPSTEQQYQELDLILKAEKVKTVPLSDGNIEVELEDELADHFKSFLKKVHCAHEVISYDITSDILLEMAHHRNQQPDYNYEKFNDLNAIYEELDRIAAKCVKGFICSLDSIGNSIESRPIKRLKIFKSGMKRKSIWVDSTTHAREWLTTATLMKILKHLTSFYANDTQVQHLLDTYEWQFVPVVNPDGYVYSWGSDPEQRNWRKNRRIRAGQCTGVDLNRNADHAWGTVGSDPDPCGETYRGMYAASEPETIAWQHAIEQEGKNILQIVSIHARGKYWMTSYGSFDGQMNKCHEDKDAKELLRVANRAADAIQGLFNQTWKRGPICSTMYKSSGSLIDYAKEKTNIRYTSLPEVRGNSFVVDPSEIESSFKEIYTGIVESIDAIEENFK